MNAHHTSHKENENDETGNERDPAHRRRFEPAGRNPCDQGRKDAGHQAGQQEKREQGAEREHAQDLNGLIAYCSIGKSRNADSN